MATLEQKITAERRVRSMLEMAQLPQPDAVEYELGCVRLFWEEPRTVLVVEFDEDRATLDEGQEAA